MTKIEMAKTLLPLVIKAQEKDIRTTLDINASSMELTHFLNGEIKFNMEFWDCEPETHEEKFNDCLTYLNNLLK